MEVAPLDSTFLADHFDIFVKPIKQNYLRNLIDNLNIVHLNISLKR